MRRAKCEKCDQKIPKNQPKLRCSLCNMYKHLKCQKLTKSDANNILHLKLDWTCTDCINSILPVNGCSAPKRTKRNCPSVQKVKVKCASCSGFSYSPRNIRTCTFCDGQVHLKCWNNDLGCTSCCESIIPGFRAKYYEIIGDPYLNNNKTYNPYARNHYTQLIGDMIESNDNESNCFDAVSEILVNCKYKKPNFNAKAEQCDNELNILSLNVQTIGNKIAHFKENLAYYEQFDALAFNETNCIVEKLPNGYDDLILDNFHKPLVKPPSRASGKGGGLVIYINKRLCEEEDIEEFEPYSEEDNNSGEFQFIKLKNCYGRQKTVILGNVYRSPAASNKPEKFNSFFDKILQKLNTNRYANKMKYLVGDFNLDLIAHESNVDCQNLIDNAHNSGFVQLVSRPTRITESSATLIDHVYTNNMDSTLSCNIVTLDISDHLAVHTRITLGSSTAESRRMSIKRNIEKVEQRVFNEANDAKFRELINEETWEEALEDNLDAQSSYNKFNEIYTKHYNAAYPLRSEHVRRRNERQNPKPWILPWLEDACARKNDLYHNFVNNPSPENKAKYDKLNEFCKKHVDLAKSNYNKKYFEQYHDNSRKQWQMINKLLNRKNRCNTTINKLVGPEGNVVTNRNEISNSFNDFFCNIASDLKKKSAPPESPVTEMNCDSLKYPVSNTIHLNDADASEIHSVIKNFKNKATRDTKISSLKIANEFYTFTNALAGVVNKSFREGIFPDELKIARVTPIYKEGAKSDVSNYRPISLLSSFSKIYEKLMHVRLLEFLDSNNSLFEMQYGFRPGRSCEHALLNAQDTILKSLNKKQVSILLLIDFSKAFDMVDHTILLRKLSHYGIRGPAHDWLKSYLSQRKQFVCVNNVESTLGDITYGVPQGSILGPLLFIIYINDIPEISAVAKFILYADDANIIITADCIEDAYSELLKLVTNLTRWVHLNGLALNLKKTKYMIFSRSKISLPEPLIISKIPIERMTETRFLGVIVDESLNWSRHVKTILSKMSRYIGIMYKIKKFLPLKARLQVYHSFVQSHINFCSLVWGFSCKSNIEAIFCKQKKGMRAVIPGFIKYFYKDGITPGHTKEYFNKYKILTVHNIITLNAIMIMKKVRFYPTLVPKSIIETISDDSPNIGSNHEDCGMWLKVYNTPTYRNSLFFKGPMLFSTLELVDDITKEKHVYIKSLKNRVRAVLLDCQNAGDTILWETSNFVLYNYRGLRSEATKRNPERVNYTRFFD